MSKKHTSLQLLKYADTFTTYHVGDTIFREGESGKHMYVVKAGTVELRLHDKHVETLGSGDILGEMALVDSAARSAGPAARASASSIACWAISKPGPPSRGCNW